MSQTIVCTKEDIESVAVAYDAINDYLKQKQPQRCPMYALMLKAAQDKLGIELINSEVLDHLLSY